MLYELRIYHINPGKMENIHKRFSQVTLDLFKEHGIHVCDFYEDADGNNTIYYICAFNNREERDIAFDSFRNCEEWKKAYAESRKDGAIVEKVESFFMNRVPYIDVDWK